MQMYIDITLGTPLIHRKSALQKLIAYSAEDYAIFGIDCHADNMERTRLRIEGTNLF